MNDFYSQFLFIVNAVWRRRLYALGVAWLVCAVGWAVVVMMPNTYTSNARLLVDTSNVLRPLLKGLAVESDIDSELDVMKETVTSRPNLASVARMTDLDVTATTPSQMDRLLDSLKARTEVRWEGTKLISISFTDTDPVRARDVVEALVTTFVEKNLGHSRQDMVTASEFLDRQIREYERQLEQAEQRLAKFKQERLSKFPNRADAESRIEDMKNQVVEAEAAEQKATSQRQALRRQLAALRTSERNAQLAELEHSLGELLTQYTEEHPEVISVRRQIEALREGKLVRRRKPADPNESGANSKRQTNVPPAPSPLREQIRGEIAQREADIAFYKDRAERLRQRLENLQSLAGQIPEVEAELVKLNRDYEVIKLKYAEMVSRREQARISRDRESRIDKIELRVVDPPRVPGAPGGPSRTILLTVALVFGIGAGGVFAVALSLLRETFSDPSKLREKFGLPVLGTVSVIASFKEHTRRVAQASAFVGCLILMLAAYGSLVLVEQHFGLANIASASDVAGFFQQMGAALKDLLATSYSVFQRS